MRRDIQFSHPDTKLEMAEWEIKRLKALLADLRAEVSAREKKFSNVAQGALTITLLFGVSLVSNIALVTVLLW